MSMKRLDLVSLRLFVSIADAASLTGAATREHMALAAVSKRVRDLEAQLDTALRDKMAAERALDKARSEITLLTEAVSGAERRAMAAEADLTTTRHEVCGLCVRLGGGVGDRFGQSVWEIEVDVALDCR